MTLLELLLVMSILALLFGATAGMLGGVDVASKAAVGQVQSVLRSARNSALAQGGASRVRIDAANGTLTPHVLEPVGTWHFESEALEGAFDSNLASAGARVESGGFLGRALCFGAPRAHASAPIGALARFDLTDGFRLQLMVRSAGGDGGSLVDVGGAAGVVLTSSQGLRGWFLSARADDGQPEGPALRPGPKVSIEAPAGSLSPGTWHQVALSCDRRSLVLELDGVAVAQSEALADLPVWRPEGALMVGDPGGTLAACLDTLGIWALSRGQTVRLGQGIAFAAGSSLEVAFDAGGHLDRRVHAGPLTLRLSFPDGNERSLRVGSFGTIE